MAWLPVVIVTMGSKIYGSSYNSYLKHGFYNGQQ